MISTALVLGLLFILPSVCVGAFASSAASPPVFNSAINLSNDASIAKDPAVSNNGQNVYVVWSEGAKGVFFRVRTDGGSTWTPPTTQSALKISNKGSGAASFPVMFTQYQSVNTGDVYAAWAQGQQVYVAASTNNGISFKTTQLSLSTSGGPAEIPSIADFRLRCLRRLVSTSWLHLRFE